VKDGQLNPRYLFSSVTEEDAAAPAAAPAPKKPVPDARAPRMGLPQGPIAAVMGVDFGTSNTRAAVAIGDRVYMIPDSQGATAQPSVVFFPQGGGVVVGAQARATMAEDPRRVVGSAKRLLGRQLADPEISGLLYSTACKLVDGGGGAVAVEIDGRPRNITEVCSEILKHLREVASRTLNVDVARAVLTCPTSF